MPDVGPGERLGAGGDRGGQVGGRTLDLGGEAGAVHSLHRPVVIMMGHPVRLQRQGQLLLQPNLDLKVFIQ